MPPCLPAADWYLQQMAATDALLQRLQSKGPFRDAASAGEQLQATLERLGLTAAELGELASGAVVHVDWRASLAGAAG